MQIRYNKGKGTAMKPSKSLHRVFVGTVLGVGVGLGALVAKQVDSAIRSKEQQREMAFLCEDLLICKEDRKLIELIAHHPQVAAARKSGERVEFSPQAAEGLAAAWLKPGSKVLSLTVDAGTLALNIAQNQRHILLERLPKHALRKTVTLDGQFTWANHDNKRWKTIEP